MSRLRGIGSPHERVKAGPHPAAAALRSVARLGHPELDGASLTASRLTHDEGAELASLVKRMRALAEEGEQASEKERSRYELLLGQAAGDKSLFDERRADAATRQKLGELRKDAKLAALPLKPKWEEPGAVVLPARAFELLTTSRDACFTLADCGLLVALYGMFSNREPGLILGAQFEKDPDGEDVLVAPEDMIIRPDSNPHPLQGGPGQVKVGVAFATLARHGWIRAERVDGTFRIKLWRARALAD